MKVEIIKKTENYRLCYCDSNKNHLQNKDYHKVMVMQRLYWWFKSNKQNEINNDIIKFRFI